MTADFNGDPLNDLESVNWASLQHAYGSAEDVPDLLRWLPASDAEAREVALYEFGTTYHQGTICCASAPAALLLVQLFNHSATPDPDKVAGLLASLALGTSYLDVHITDEKRRAGPCDFCRGSRFTRESSRLPERRRPCSFGRMV